MTESRPDAVPWPRRVGRRLWSGPHVVSQQVPSYLASWQAHNRRALGLDGPLWIVLGDSLSQGIGASSWDRGWVHRSLHRLDAAASEPGQALRVVNLSRSGATTLDVLDRQLSELDQLRGEGHTPVLTSLAIGANDMIRRHLRQCLEDRFATILPRLPRGTVVAELPQPLAVARRVNHVIGAASTEGRLRPVSVRSRAMLTPRNAAADLFHPNDGGHQILADLITPALLAALGR